MKADAFVTKPFNLAYLEEIIRSLLRNRGLLREHYTCELTPEIKAGPSKKPDRKFLNEFTTIVENSISNENFTVYDICRETGISLMQLNRKLSALPGYNVNDYILPVRLQKAKYLRQIIQKFPGSPLKSGFLHKPASQPYLHPSFQ